MVPEWFTILNTIHSEFHGARSDYIVAGIGSADGAEVDRMFSYVDLGERADYTHDIRRTLQCIASCMNIFDKIAFFLRSYYHVEIGVRQVYFSGPRSIFTKVQSPTFPGVQENFAALRSMSRDLENSFFRRVQRYRDSITHRYVVVIKEPGVDPDAAVADDASRILATDARKLAKTGLLVAKAGIYYLTALVTSHDWHLEKGRHIERRPGLPLGRPRADV